MLYLCEAETICPSFLFTTMLRNQTYVYCSYQEQHLSGFTLWSLINHLHWRHSSHREQINRINICTQRSISPSSRVQTTNVSSLLMRDGSPGILNTEIVPTAALGCHLLRCDIQHTKNAQHNMQEKADNITIHLSKTPWIKIVKKMVSLICFDHTRWQFDHTMLTFFGISISLLIV